MLINLLIISGPSVTEFHLPLIIYQKLYLSNQSFFVFNFIIFYICGLQSVQDEMNANAS